MAGGDPLALPRITVLLPTRRAVRALRDAFLRTAPDGKSPERRCCCRGCGRSATSIRTSCRWSKASATSGDLAVPPAIPELRRRLLLTRLVLKWGRRGRPRPAAAGPGRRTRREPRAASRHGGDRGSELRPARELAPADLAEHWQIVRKFLEILPQAWPAMLAAEGALDPADRRNRLLAQQAAIWRRTPPRDPVIAAGLDRRHPGDDRADPRRSRRSISGAVILPGLDRRCDAAEWAAIEARRGPSAISDGEPAESARPRAGRCPRLGPTPSPPRSSGHAAARAPVAAGRRGDAAGDDDRRLARPAAHAPPTRSPGSAATIAPARTRRR